MSYFKYSFLNSLRDELGLTMTRQKVTFFHFLYLLIPACGIGVGIAWGTQANSFWKTIIGGAIGVLAGGFAALEFPKLLWNMLRLFVRKGWFLQPEFPKNIPTMTSDDFISRSKTFLRELRQHFLVWTFFLIVGNLVFVTIFSQKKPASVLVVFYIFCYVVFFIGYFFLRNRAAKQLLRKHGLQCPACGREITDAAGMSSLPYLGLCRHCGTKVVEILPS